MALRCVSPPCFALPARSHPVRADVAAQFFITTVRTEWLDDKHVVFGEVIEGMKVLQTIEDCGSPSGQPVQKVMISSSGVVGSEEKAV
jgi:cyclophilin family peptidyl-prolyl cis-trans isomerase